MTFLSAQISTVQRSKGHNAVAAIAYNARAKMTLNVYDKETGIETKRTWDYSKLAGLAFSKIYLPEELREHAEDSWIQDRELLWNAAEKAENRHDATTAHKMMLPLPNELSLDANIALLEDFVTHLTDQGMIVDVSIHDDDPGNIHAHLLGTMRKLEQNAKGEFVFARTKERAWHHRNFVRQMRELHSSIINKHLPLNGVEKTWYHQSYKELGIELIPTKHEGPARNIKNAELVARNKEIALLNFENIKNNPDIIVDFLMVNKSFFTRERLAQVIEKKFLSGVDIRQDSELSEEFSKLVDGILESDAVVQAPQKSWSGDVLYSGQKRRALEQKLVSSAKDISAKAQHRIQIDSSDLEQRSFFERVFDKLQGRQHDPKKELSLEQRSAILHLLQGGDLSVLLGLPGAGKTTVLKEVKRQYNKHGFKVIGLTPSSSAALQLSSSLGVECFNIAQWRKMCKEALDEKFSLEISEEDLEAKNKGDLPKKILSQKHIMIVDEASMVDLKSMSYLLTQCYEHGAKLILVGDENQLPSVGWAGSLQKIMEINESVKLIETRRQRNKDHQEATQLLSKYQLRDALTIYQEAGDIEVHDTQEIAKTKCVQAFVQEYIEQSLAQGGTELVGNRKLAIGVLLNETRHKINAEVRSHLKSAGILHGPEHELCNWQFGSDQKKISVAIGEQIVFSRNIKLRNGVDIANGEVATILGVSKATPNSYANLKLRLFKSNGDQIKVKLSLKDFWQFHSKFFDKRPLFEHGYAVTAHKLQGATLDNMYVMLEKGASFEAFVVLASRHRESVKFFVGSDLLLSSRLSVLGEDIRLVQKRYDIVDARLKADIDLDRMVHLLAKSADNSFADNHWRLSDTDEDVIFRNYMFARRDTVEAIRKMTIWKEQQRRQGAENVAFWDNPELWNEFKRAHDLRGAFACDIMDDFPRYRTMLLQYNINFASVEEHVHAYKKKYDVTCDLKTKNEQISLRGTDFFNRSDYQGLIQEIGKIDNVDLNIVIDCFTRVIDAIETHESDLLQKSEEMEFLKFDRTDKQGLLSQIEASNHRVITSYLQRVFRAPKGYEHVQDYGALLLKNFESASIMYGDSVMKMIEKSPEIIGELHGIGIGSKIAFSSERKLALSLFKTLPQELKLYQNDEAKAVELRAALKENLWEPKIQQLQKEMELIENQRPMEIDERFINLVGKHLQNFGREVIDEHVWEQIAQSEEFINVSMQRYVSKIYEPKSEKRLESETVRIVDRDQNQKRNFKPLTQINQFQEVKERLNSASIASIFTKYAPILNQDGKIERSGNNIKCGSISMDLSRNDGLWYRFSDQSGGDIFDLVEQATNCSRAYALEIVADYVGVNVKKQGLNHSNKDEKEAAKLNQPAKQSISQLLRNNLNIEPAPAEWRPYRIVPPQAPKMDLAQAKKMLYQTSSEQQAVTALYPYHSRYGELLGYTMRVEVKNRESGLVVGKKVLPLAYCYLDDGKQSDVAHRKSLWLLKGFTSSDGSKPILGLEKLAQRPDAPVLIVEGEKTAQRAQEMLPKYVVLTWMGGTASADKACWSEVAGRLAVIWPDNDEVGKIAAQKIKRCIDAQNKAPGLVKILDLDVSRFPKKWDLGDELPKHMDESNIAAILERHLFRRVKNEINNSLGNKVLELTDHLRYFDQMKGLGSDEINSSCVQKHCYHETIARLILDSESKTIKPSSVIDDESMKPTTLAVRIQNSNAEKRYEELAKEYEISIAKIEKEYKARGRAFFRADSNNRQNIARDLTKHLAVYHHAMYEQVLEDMYLESLVHDVVKEVNQAHLINADHEQRDMYSRLLYKTTSSDWQNDRASDREEKWQDLIEQVKDYHFGNTEINAEKAKNEGKLIDQEIYELRSERQGAQNTKQALEILEIEMNRLSRLHGSKMHKNMQKHSPDHARMVEEAHICQTKEVIKHFSGLHQIMDGRNYQTMSKLEQGIKATTEPLGLCREILASYRTEMMEKLHHGLAIIEKGGSVTLNDRDFSCPVELMIAVKASHSHIYHPTDKIAALHQSVMNKNPERFKQIQMSQNLALTM